MLDGLDAIDWASLTHAYGSAADVPDKLRALLSDDPNVLKKTHWALTSNIYHQGTTYQATAYAVPFLLELLEQRESVPARRVILAILAAIAEGSRTDLLYLEAEQRTAGGEHADDTLRAILRANYDSVRAGIPLYQRFLRHPNAELRALAAETLRHFPGDAVQIIPELRAAYERARTSKSRLDTLFAIHDLIADPDLPLEVARTAALPTDLRAELVAFLQPIMGTSKDRDLALGAAMTAVVAAGADATDEAVERVVAGLAALHRTGFRDAHRHHMIQYGLIRVLASLPHPRSLTALLRALSDARDPLNAHEIAEELLKMVFGSQPMRGRYDSGGHGMIWVENDDEIAEGDRAAADEAARQLDALNQKLRSQFGNMASQLGMPQAQIDGILQQADEDVARIQRGMVQMPVKHYRLPAGGEDQVPLRESLTDAQRQMLETLAATRAFWKLQTNLLAVYGLPQTRDGLRVFLTNRPS